MVVVGNKSDLFTEATVSEDEGRKFAKQHEAIFANTSCKTGEGVKEMFEDIEKIIMNNVRKNEEEKEEDDEKPEINWSLIDEDFETSNKKERCCRGKGKKKCNLCCFCCCNKNK